MRPGRVLGVQPSTLPRMVATLAIGSSLALLLVGCAGTPGAHLAQRRARVEAEIAAKGLNGNPAIDAAREELEAAVMLEGADVAIDGFELRAGVVHERDEKMQALARLPLRNLAELHAQKEARLAQSEVALARLEEVTLAERVAECLPSLEYQVRSRQEEIFAGYARRHAALLEWNREMRAAGLIDEVGAKRFELSSNVKLATRDPSGLPEPLPRSNSDSVLDVLPAPLPGVPPLSTAPDVLHRVLVSNQPSVGVVRARQREFEALSRRETMKRIPSPRFVDVGYEPVAYSGDKRQVAARVAFEIPFGREASANHRRYQALARAERSRVRALLEVQRREAERALGEINIFRERADHWLALADLADASEEVAERWWQDRQAEPGQISSLLDSVYAARVAVLEARQRAGRAGCVVIEATGVTVSEWPR